MRFKKTVLSLSTLGAVATPVALAVSCGSSNETKTNDTVDGLNIQLENLQKQLDDLKNSKNIKSASQESDYETKITELNSQIDSLKTKIEDASKTSAVPQKKEKTIAEKTVAFQAFQLLHSSEFSTLSFDDVKKTFDPNLPMARGIESFSLSQTASYLQNLAIKLGFKEDLPELKDLSQTPSGDSVIDTDRAEVYTHTKNIIDGLKTMDDTQMNAVFDLDNYTNFAKLYSIGDPLTIQRFAYSGIDTSSLGPIPDPDDSNTSHLNNYPNLTLNTSNNTKVQLFSSLPWLEDDDTSYDPAKIFGTQRIDADKPGSVITTLDFNSTVEVQKNAAGKFEAVELLPMFSKSFEKDGLANTYPIAPATDRQHNINILEAVIKKMSVIFSPENKDATISLRKNAAKNDVSQRLIDVLEYLGSKFESLNEGFAMDDVEKIYDQMNNGSHYFKSIELFARGLSGVVFSNPGADKYAGYVEDSSSIYKGIIDMAFDHLEGTLLPWGTLQGKGLYTLASEKFSKTLDFRDYKPQV